MRSRPQVKLFGSLDLRILESEINKFLIDLPRESLIDVKFNSSDTSFDAAVIYKVHVESFKETD